MRVGLFVVAIVCVSLGGCGGQVLLDGSCLLEIGLDDRNVVCGGHIAESWCCTASAGEARLLPPCQSGVAAGGSCQEDESVQTTNTTLPAMFTGPAPNCFDCSGGGTGTEWTCGSGGWEAAATYSCKP